MSNRKKTMRQGKYHFTHSQKGDIFGYHICGESLASIGRRFSVSASVITRVLGEIGDELVRCGVLVEVTDES